MAHTPREATPIAERHRDAIETLVQQHSQASPELVERLYRNELGRLEADARITHYLPVILSRKVRERLRREQRFGLSAHTGLPR